MSKSILFMPVGTLPNLIEKATSTKLSEDERDYLWKVAEILERYGIDTKTQLMKRLGK